MEQRKFDRATAEGIRARLADPECLEVRNGDGGLGLYVAKDYKDDAIGLRKLPSRVAGVAVLDWSPAEDMDWPGAQNPKTAPALPIPFTAQQLAAFLLDGIGRSLEEVTKSRIGDALDPDAFGDFHPDERWATEALELAYALAKEARAIVGEYDFEQQNYAYRFAHLARVKEQRARNRSAIVHAAAVQQEAQGRSMVKAIDGEWVAWRKAMVRQLLGPAASDPHDPASPVAPSAAGADTSHAGTSTEQIDVDPFATPGHLIQAFGAFTGMDASWFKNLSDSPALLRARRSKGEGGRTPREALFDPYAVMQWLMDEKRKKGRRISSETAWRRLREFFPDAYRRHQIGDPNSH